MNHISGHIGEPEASSLVFKNQLLLVHVEQVHETGMEVMHMHRILHHVDAKIVRNAIGENWLYSGTRHPHNEALVKKAGPVPLDL